MELVEYLHAQPGLLVADAQGFVRMCGAVKEIEAIAVDDPLGYVYYSE